MLPATDLFLLMLGLSLLYAVLAALSVVLESIPMFLRRPRRVRPRTAHRVRRRFHRPRRRPGAISPSAGRRRRVAGG
ncbi:hypothetical protein [uncultured Thiohalocapsa sp.]|uniref:hypothetical protein n=1 Tax=uncultured Thiohalocapsa sp. TaxID=768990 RepID=UPI0025EF2457|nr:hypothetical protein [uncultured Thiohalocapsa sp.]